MKFFIHLNKNWDREKLCSKDKYPAGCFDGARTNIDCALFRFAVGRGWRCWAATFIRLHLLLICCNQVGGTLTSIHFLYNSQLETFYVLRDWIFQRWMKLYEYIAGKNIKMSLQSFLRFKCQFDPKFCIQEISIFEPKDPINSLGIFVQFLYWKTSDFRLKPVSEFW